MKPKIKRISIVIFMVALLVGVVCWYQWTPTRNSDEATPQQAKWLGRVIEDEMRRGNGKFVLQGVVVDDAGQPLDHVDVSVIKSQYTGLGDFRDSKEELVVSKKFNFTYSGYSMVELSFYKKGYEGWGKNYVLRTSIGDPKNTDPETRDEGGTVDGLFQKKDIKIVLKKELPKADLMPGSLRTHDPILDQSRPMVVQISVERTKGFYPRLTVNRKTDYSYDVSDIIHIWTDLDQNGQVKVISKSENAKMADLGLPRALHLKSLDPNGGFIRCHYPLKTFYFKDMITAPETGYQQEVVLTSSDWIDFHSFDPERKGLFLYVKIGNRYGKMKIGCSVHNGEISVGGELYLQSYSDVGRNLYN